MNREQAEKLLAALIFNDLDETSKAELTAYLQTDDELRYRLADLRMAVKLTDDAVNEGPDPVLGEQRLKQLKRLAKAGQAKGRVFQHPRFMAVAAVITVALVLLGVSMPVIESLGGGARAVRSTASVASLEEQSDDGVSYYMGSSQAQNRAAVRSSAIPAAPPTPHAPVASRPATRAAPSKSAAPPERNYGMVAQPGGSGMADTATDRQERYAGGAGGMGGMGMGGVASDSKDNRHPGIRSAGMGDMDADGKGNYATGAYGGGMRGRGNADPAATTLNTGFEGLDSRFEGGSGVKAENESVKQQVAASQQRLLQELQERRASETRGAPKAWPAEVIRGSKVEKTELEVAKETGGKPVAMESESAVRFGRGVRDKEADSGGGVYQGPRQDVAAKTPARADGVVNIGGAVGYGETVTHGWKGEVTPQKPAAPVPTPAHSDSLATVNKKLDQLSEAAASARSEKRVSALGDVPLVGELFRKGVQPKANAEALGQAIGGATVAADVPSVQVQKEPLVLATGLEDFAAEAKAKAEQKRVAAGKALSDLRQQAETNRQDRINELMERTKAYWKQQQYEAALGQLDALLAIDPLNDKALTEKQMVQDMIYLRKQSGLDQLSARQRAEMVMGADEASVPYANEITYPKDWREMSLPSHFKVVPVNPWVMTDQDALSTFALDVDTASYALCRRFIRGGYLPPIGAVRMEEFINAFDYAYPQRDDQPFTVYAEGTPSPFAPAGQDLTLLKVAVKARTVGRDQRRAANLVFVVDASASMGQMDRLPLVQAAANQLVDKLSEADRVSLITCANDARLHLEAVPARQKDAIHDTINAIQPAGPTNLLAGLKLAYAMARKNFVAGQTNEVVLCSDGVANVGQTEAEAMLQEVAQDRKQAITLTCVGVGYGAYNDAFLEALANQGDGRYVFLDSSEPAQQALVGQLAASLENVASDARIQVQFNPNRVRRYRLIGYEDRDIEDKRFRDDTVNAGAVGSGQCSTALYELELAGSRESGMGVPPMQHRRDADATTEGADLGTVFVRYRNTESGQMEEISRPLADSIVRRRSVEEDPRLFLAAGAARFAEWLRQSEHAQNTALTDVQRLLDQVSAALPLDRDVEDLAALAHQAEGLPRAPEATPAPEVQR